MNRRAAETPDEPDWDERVLDRAEHLEQIARGLDHAADRSDALAAEYRASAARYRERAFLEGEARKYGPAMRLVYREGADGPEWRPAEDGSS